jgi:hypothetical protein
MRGDFLATTALSHQKPVGRWKVAGYRALARLSQCIGCVLLPAVVSALSSGCLVADAPDYGGPQQTPPYIESSTITPSPYSLITVGENMPDQPFTFKVYSEDAGEKLVTAFFQDYGLVDLKPLEDQEHAPSTLDQPRTISVLVNLNRIFPDGCHQLTLLVMHESTWNTATDRPDPNKAAHDVTSVTWWLHVRPNASDPATLYDCPSPEQIRPVQNGAGP